MFRKTADRIYLALDLFNEWAFDSWAGPYLAAAAIFWLLPLPALIEAPLFLGVLVALVVADPTIPHIGRFWEDDDE